MFAKPNPKGLALILHTLLISFDHSEEGEDIKGRFAVCWFPYTMIELKEFKAVALQVSQDVLVP